MVLSTFNKSLRNFTALCLFAGCVLFSGCGNKVVSAQSQKPQKVDKQYVVIFSLDAFRWDLASMAQTPALDSIARVGVFSEIKPCFPANTFPNHYSMATGLYPDHHGIVNNSFYDKNLNDDYAISKRTAVNDPKFYYGEGIWETIERQGKTASVFGWVGLDPFVATHTNMLGVKEAYNSRLSRKQLVDKVLAELCKSSVAAIPDLVMCYFDEPDATEHNYGPVSAETKRVVEDIDSVIRYFLREVKKSPVYSNLNIIFTADHGMTELSADRYTNLYDYISSYDVYYNNSNPASIEPKNSGDYAKVLAALKAHEKDGHYTVLERDNMPERLHYGTCKHREYPIYCNPDCGWTVVYKKGGGGSVYKKGSHGFDPDFRDMHMVFYAFGPAFKEGYKHNVVFENLNDHYIIARILGVQPAKNNDCSPKDVEGLFR